MPVLTDAVFSKLSEQFRSISGIGLKPEKKYLVVSRLQSLVGEGKRFADYGALADSVAADRSGQLGTLLVNTLTTNYTYFFRDTIHFSFLARFVRGYGEEDGPLRLWSAGCASGEEAYSMAATVAEYAPRAVLAGVKILATDISPKALSAANAGRYPRAAFGDVVGEPFIEKYFEQRAGDSSFSARRELRELLSFRMLNLMDAYPFAGKFDVVFLRNVLIYFDRSAKETIMGKMADVLKPNGYLALGLSESLVGCGHQFLNLKHSIYQKRP